MTDLTLYIIRGLPGTGKSTLGMFIEDKGIDDKLSPEKRLTDLFYCDERYRSCSDEVFTGPLDLRGG